MHEPASRPTEIWKAQMDAVAIHWPQIAAQRPDRAVAFSNVTGANRPYRWDTATGALTPLLPDGVPCGYGLLSPDGEWFTFFRDTGGNERGQVVRVPFDGGPIVSLTPGAPDVASSTTPFPLPVLTQSATGNRIAFVVSDSDGFRLCAVDIAGDGAPGPPRVLLAGRPLLRAPVLSADGAIAAVCSNARTGKQQYDLWILDRDGAEIARWSDGETASVEAIAFSPIPGDTRLLCTSDASGFKRPVLVDAATGDAQPLVGSDAPAGELVPLCWSEDAWSVLLCGFENAQQRLYLWDAAMRRTVAVPHPPGTFVHYGGFGTHLANDGTARVLFTDEATPVRAVAIAPDGTVRTLLAGPDAPAGPPLRSVTFASSDGATVQAWLATPPGDGPFPTVLHVHGGPHGVTTRTYGLGTSWVERGFAFLSVNFRGSTTFGREFQQKIWGDVGHWELEDMVAARNFLVDSGIAVPDRIAVTGGSYGGYLTLLALGKRPDLFAAGAATVALADNAMAWEDASPLLQGIMTASFRGTPAERPDLYRDSSPIAYADHFRAPILVVQGRNDTRCPARQMEAFEAALRERGKPIEVLWYDGGHGFGNRERAVHYQERALDFLEEALRTQKEGEDGNG